MTHPPHPPSEMVAALMATLADDGWRLPDLLVQNLIRTMFAHVNREAMIEAAVESVGLEGEAALAMLRRGAEGVIDAALAASLAAALPGGAT